jgi:trimethylamine--corrinoid protein Co-methyltransferase
MQSSVIEHQSTFFHVLSDDQIMEIKRAAFDILEKTGCKVLHKGAVELLKKEGAVVEGDQVKVPRHIVEECIRTAPNGFVIYNRDGKRAMEVEGRKSYYGTACASPNTRDPFTGEVHKTLVSDIAMSAKVADALSNIDWVMPMGSAQDVPALAADLHEFEAAVTNTIKPIVFIGYSPRGMELVFEMAAEVIGGLDNLRARPFVLSYPEPISPLVFPDEIVDRMFVAADLFMPQIPGPTVQPGSTAPVTLAGAVAQLVAEGLMSLTLIQLRRPGAPCFLGGNVGIFDMATGNLSIGAPEMSLSIAAQAEVAQSFGLPTWGLAGSTDAKTIDAQAGVESAFSVLAQGLAGLNLIHDVGYMDNAMVCSIEMLVLGDEAIGMTKRFIRGFQVNSETLARSLIEDIGPGGNFLQEDHTLRHFRTELWSPTLMTRRRYDDWQQEGAKDMTQRIQEKVKDLVDHHEVPSLPERILAAIEKIKLRGEAELIKQQT